MKTQKLLVIVALVCLMAFLSVSTFAQKAQAEAKPGLKMVQFLKAALKDEGFKAKREGDDLIIEEQVVLKNAFTVQTFEDFVDKIKVSLVELEEEDPPDLPTEELADFRQLRRCWNTTEFIFNWQYTTCELHPNQAGDLLCKVRAIAEAVLNDINCIFAYLDED